jgi:hypothetical protein
VRDRELRFFKSQDDPQELGCINLRSVRSIVPSVVEGSLGPGSTFASPGAFSVTSDDSVFVLDAGSAEEMRSWVVALRNTQVICT